jgi:hypothetical protein
VDKKNKPYEGDSKMKRVIIALIAVMFLVSGFAIGQDCGNCPSKASCTGKTDKAKKSADPIVFVKKDGKFYHTKDCKAVAEGKIKIKLSEAAKKGLKPCEKCKAPALPAPPKKKAKKK